MRHAATILLFLVGFSSLAWTAEPRTVDEWIVRLKSGNPSLRQEAAKALGNIGADAEPALAALEEVAEMDINAFVRKAAAEAVEAVKAGVRGRAARNERIAREKAAEAKQKAERPNIDSKPAAKQEAVSKERDAESPLIRDSLDESPAKPPVEIPPGHWIALAAHGNPSGGLTERRQYITGVALSSDGSALASSGMDGLVKLWKLTPGPGGKVSWTELRRLDTSTGPGVVNWVNDVALSRDGQLVAAASDDKTVWVWNAATGQLLQRFRHHEAKVQQAIFFADGKQLLTADEHGGACIWKVGDAGEPKGVKVPADGIALSRDGLRVIGSDGNDTLLLELPTGRELAKLGGYASRDGRRHAPLAISPDSRTAIKVDGNQNGIQLWSLKDGKLLKKGIGNLSRPVALGFLADGRQFLSLDGVELRRWDVETGDETGRFRLPENHRASCMAVARWGFVVIGTHGGDVLTFQLPK